MAARDPLGGDIGGKDLLGLLLLGASLPAVRASGEDKCESQFATWDVALESWFCGEASSLVGLRGMQKPSVPRPALYLSLPCSSDCQAARKRDCDRSSPVCRQREQA